MGSGKVACFCRAGQQRSPPGRLRRTGEEDAMKQFCQMEGGT